MSDEILRIFLALEVCLFIMGIWSAGQMNWFVECAMTLQQCRKGSNNIICLELHITDIS